MNGMGCLRDENQPPASLQQCAIWAASPHTPPMTSQTRRNLPPQPSAVVLWVQPAAVLQMPHDRRKILNPVPEMRLTRGRGIPPMGSLVALGELLFLVLPYPIPLFGSDCTAPWSAPMVLSPDRPPAADGRSRTVPRLPPVGRRRPANASPGGAHPPARAPTPPAAGRI